MAIFRGRGKITEEQANAAGLGADYRAVHSGVPEVRTADMQKHLEQSRATSPENRPLVLDRPGPFIDSLYNVPQSRRKTLDSAVSGGDIAKMSYRNPITLDQGLTPLAFAKEIKGSKAVIPDRADQPTSNAKLKYAFKGSPLQFREHMAGLMEAERQAHESAEDIQRGAY